MATHILFVCHGNICRSPMAEFIMKDLVERKGLSDEFHIESCATSTEEIGNDVYPPAQRELRKQGIPFSRRSARQMKASDYDRFDLIIAMDDQNLRNLQRFVNGDPGNKVSLMMSHAREERGVADPWYTGDFTRTYEDISRACKALLEKLI